MFSYVKSTIHVQYRRNTAACLLASLTVSEKSVILKVLCKKREKLQDFVVLVQGELQKKVQVCQMFFFQPWDSNSVLD